MKKSQAKASEDTVLVLRTCNPDMTSKNGFKWPTSGPVEAPDFKPTVECGHGLHGWLWGEGDGALGNWDQLAKWLVVEVAKADIVDLTGKVKFPRGQVVFCGSRNGPKKYLCAAPNGRGRAIIGASVDTGNSGKSVSGNSGKSVSGNSGKSVSGNSGKSVSGKNGLSLTGPDGSAQADEKGLLIITWYDKKAERNRVTVAYVGEAGIQANKFYRCNPAGEISEAV